MAKYNNDERVQGLHYLTVVKATRDFVAKVTQNGGPAIVTASSPMLSPELWDLYKAVNKLDLFERQARTRGTIRLGDEAEVSQLLDAAAGFRDMTHEQHALREMSDDEAAQMASQEFDVDDAFASEPDAAPEPEPVAPVHDFPSSLESLDEDPFAVPEA